MSTAAVCFRCCFFFPICPKCSQNGPATQAQISCKSVANHMICRLPHSMLFGTLICTDLQLICTLQITANQSPSTFEKNCKTRANQRKSPQITSLKDRRKNKVDLYRFAVQMACSTISCYFLLFPAISCYVMLVPAISWYRCVMLFTAISCSFSRLKCIQNNSINMHKNNPKIHPQMTPKITPKWTPKWIPNRTQKWTPKLTPKGPQNGYKNAHQNGSQNAPQN